jgi:hypothetical protein
VIFFVLEEDKERKKMALSVSTPQQQQQQVTENRLERMIRCVKTLIHMGDPKNIDSDVVVQRCGERAVILVFDMSKICKDPNGKYVLWLCHTNPLRWQLSSPDDRACVDTLSYNTVSYELCIRLVDRCAADADAKRAEKNWWEEKIPFTGCVDSRNLSTFTLSEYECVSKHALVVDLATLVAREAVAMSIMCESTPTAIARLPNAELAPPLDKVTNLDMVMSKDTINSKVPCFVISIYGIRLIGTRTMDPAYWSSNLLPNNVRDNIKTRYFVKERVMDIAIFPLAIRNYIDNRSSSQKRSAIDADLT